MTDNLLEPDPAIIEQIRRSHASAKPTTANPAWLNTHRDLGRVLAYVDFLELRLARAEFRDKAGPPPDWDNRKGG